MNQYWARCPHCNNVLKFEFREELKVYRGVQLICRPCGGAMMVFNLPAKQGFTVVKMDTEILKSEDISPEEKMQHVLGVLMDLLNKENIDYTSVKINEVPGMVEIFVDQPETERKLLPPPPETNPATQITQEEAEKFFEGPDGLSGLCQP